MLTEKIVRKTIELLIRRADSEWDFDVAKYTIDDYVSVGYKVGDLYEVFHKKYKTWKQRLTSK